MCGIAGWLSVEDTNYGLRQETVRMVEALRHRGPDDMGVDAGDGWAIGTCRLAIQDRSSAGHQPMRRGDLIAVYNGEIYNFRELREELQGLGFAFESRSDTEVFIRAFEAWGVDAFDRFNGMFAAVLVDVARRRAWLVRDRFGEKPLFLARLRHGLAFASELKSIVEVARDELSIDSDGLAGYFRYLYVPGPKTIFKGVTKVPPGTWMEVNLATAEVHGPHAWWELPTPEPADVEPGAVLETLREAVRRRLVADVPVGAFLSGGTDSSLVASCMRSLVPDVHTYSVGFAEQGFDERAWAGEVARRLDTRHEAIELTAPDAMEILVGCAEAYDEPFADSSAIAMMAVSRLARREVTVALSGDGGDEVFGGYHRYRVRRLYRAAAHIPPVVGQHVGRVGVVRRRAARLPDHARAASPADAYQETMSLWKRQDLARLVAGAQAPDTVRRAFDEAPGGHVERMMRADARTYLVDDILQKVDRATMAASLEARTPFLDPDVVRLGLSAAHISGRRPGEKTLLRDALKLVLPPEIVDRRKRGFTVPIGEWLRGDLRPLVEDLILAPGGDAPYDREEAARLARRHLEGRHPHTTARLWTLVAFELWRRRWGF